MECAEFGIRNPYPPGESTLIGLNAPISKLDNIITAASMDMVTYGARMPIHWAVAPPTSPAETPAAATSDS